MRKIALVLSVLSVVFVAACKEEGPKIPVVACLDMYKPKDFDGNVLHPDEFYARYCHGVNGNRGCGYVSAAQHSMHDKDNAKALNDFCKTK